ncbi:MAG: gephyrin-like molybdotransferase Glp [Pseudomonadota bacterium]
MTTPPPLKNDCFALPPGVAWTPVDEALARLKASLHPIAGTAELDAMAADGHILARPVVAKRANPPVANAAVDGFGFLASTVAGSVISLPLITGRAAAGAPYEGSVPPGNAVRILTGAALPSGVDTVVLEEDCAIEDGTIFFRGPLKAGANARRAGEDAQKGDQILPPHQRVRPQDLALMAATGVTRVTVFRRLRVGVLSTGDELRPAGHKAAAHQVYDANRPMLLALLARWGFEPIDLGQAPDHRADLAAALTRAAHESDVIITSGGASAGDEDHLSALIKSEGQLSVWRIAVKPGRPLALGFWQGTPVFGLPGNPVAAFVCTLVFAAPALSMLAGGSWNPPCGMKVPAAFAKSKKQGRREYLRARLNAQGAAEVFPSEGSGRITGLSWSDGLVELDDGAATITPGTLVRFIPYSAFGQ